MEGHWKGNLITAHCALGIFLFMSQIKPLNFGTAPTLCRSWVYFLSYNFMKLAFSSELFS